MIKSLLTPDLDHIAKIHGHDIFSNGFTFSIDEKLSDGYTSQDISDLLERLNYPPKDIKILMPAFECKNPFPIISEGNRILSMEEIRKVNENR